MVERKDLTARQDILDDLLLVRRGTAFWHRKVEQLTDAELDGPTLLPGWNRRHLIAHVGYNARAIGRLVLWANTGDEHPMYASPDARLQEIELGATMPSRALRHLNYHAAVSLNVEWRDSPEDAWQFEVKTAQGRTVPLSETLWMRAREVWLHAVDLDNGANFSDLPRAFLLDLLRDITQMWVTRGTSPNVSIVITDVPEAQPIDLSHSNQPTKTVRGNLAALVGWASGRSDGTNLAGATDVVRPRWL